MVAASELSIRPAVDTDVEGVKELFVETYGHDYPFQQFYDTTWLKKAVFDDDTVFLIAEQDGRVAGTISIMLSAGEVADLIGEFGRLVVHPDVRGGGAGSRLFEAAMEYVSRFVRFGFAEGRTAHIGSQKILERSGFSALGYEPLKYKLLDRESMVLYGRLFGRYDELRRNNPRLIPEVAPLAMNVLQRVGLPSDVIVAEDEDGFPTSTGATLGDTRENFHIEDLSENGWSPLLRIERGRVKGREVFGNLSLSHGFFKIKNRTTRYLVAREGDAVLGGLGFTYDPIDQKVRIFELIGFEDDIKGTLLCEAKRIAEEELNAVYIEADVSAYAPAIQRTLERMGFMAVAYCPSMVFEDVERLDVIRMAHLALPYFREDVPLTESASETRELVERSMDDRHAGARVLWVARSSVLFEGLEEGDMTRLARLGRVREVAQGERLATRGEEGERLFLLASGEVCVSLDGRDVGHVRPGDTVGEMALLDSQARCADVTASVDCEVVEIMRDDLARLMAQRPRLAAAVLRNLAVSLANKLRSADARLAAESG